MKSNPILEEVWRIKDQLAAEAGYDVDRFFDNLQKWTVEHPPTGPVVRNAGELRELLAEQEHQRTAQSNMALNEVPPTPGPDR
jgi:hypothetical protein